MKYKTPESSGLVPAYEDNNDFFRTTMLEAEPEPIVIASSRTAVIVIDMQNAFVSGGACVI